MKRKKTTDLPETLRKLNLTTMVQHYETIAEEAARGQLGHVEYLGRLADIESQARYERSVARRIKRAAFPVVKSLDQFRWSWPTEINRPQIQDLFRLRFTEQNVNVVFMGNVGLGKTHLAIALAHTACLHDISVLFTSAVDIVNTLSAAQAVDNLPKALKRYLAPRLLVVDELGYLPMDKRGSDLLFQVISARYERGSIALTTNTQYKKWARIF
ncbi:IS21-like element helper ATPase IstB, partial [Verrucomicrobiota bacterium]